MGDDVKTGADLPQGASVVMLISANRSSDLPDCSVQPPFGLPSRRLAAGAASKIASRSRSAILVRPLDAASASAARRGS
jgi:hypothetical protein